MKKYLILIILLLTITSCKDDKTENIEVPEINETTITPYIDNNPIKVGLYQNNKLIKEYKTPTNENHKEIGVFNILYTNEEQLNNNSIKYNFNKYYNQYKNIDNYKIGFYISFEAEGKKIEKTILGPEDKHSMTPYLYNYLYDDIHQEDGVWYSHIEPEDMKENTIFSSIKLYSAQEGSKIKYPINLTVFTYDSNDDFNELGYYRGNSYYTITIIN